MSFGRSNSRRILPPVAPRFDSDNLVLSLSVADLIEATGGRNLGFANRGGYERMWLGQAIHSRYQEERRATDATYRVEVHLALELEHRGWTVRLTGRADGLRGTPETGITVEEIKSVRRGGQLSAATEELYQRQAALYAWMLHRQGIENVEAELVLIEIGSDEVDHRPVEIALKATEAAVRRRLNALLREHEEAREAAAARRGAGERLEFPYPTPRPGQAAILEAVELALTQGDHLLLEAPTGIGKTVAALLPALRYALRTDKRVFVLTAKTLQQEMATQVLELLNTEGAFHSLRLRAKAKMCANDEVLCHEEYCPYARDYYQKVQSSHLLRRLPTEFPNMDPDTLFEIAKLTEVCPFEVSLELSRKAQVVVCDYNYAFDPYVGLSDFSPDNDLDDTILVVDEIHNLVARGRGYYSPTLSSAAARKAARAMESAGPEPILEANRQLALALAALIEKTADDAFEEVHPDAQETEASLPEDDLLALRARFDQAFVDYLEFRRETKSFRSEDLFTGLYFDFLRFLNGLVLSASDSAVFSRCVERSGDDRRFSVLCKDAARFLGDTIGRTHSTIGLSATLSPFDFYRDLLGFDVARTATARLGTPFPEENRRIVIDATVATTYKQRAENYRPIAQRLGEFAAAVPGNCLALFPSYQFLSEVAAHLEPSGKRVFIQNRTDGDRERQTMLDTLRSALLGDVLLLAVAGGVFAEGVDYPGKMLSAVAVVGPCLPPVSLEQNLLKRYFDERFERGFEYAYVVPGMTRVVQAAGRLIRSQDDVGVIALFDRRFLYSPYREHIATDWVPEAGVEELMGSPAQVALEFFRNRA